jgi:hypothetical protein
MQRPISDWAGNIAAFALVITMNVVSNALPLNGQTKAEISASYASLFTPAGFTFSIWGVIYVALLVFVIWQALPAQRSSEKVAGLSAYFKANCLANALWLVVWHYDLLAISLIVMLAILATLILIYRRLITAIDSAPFSEHLVLYMPFSLYTGWITLATIANASVLQTAYGWDSVGITAVQWTLAKLALVGAVGATLVVRHHDIPFALVVAWGAFGISVMQAPTPAVAGAATTLCLLALLLVAGDGVRRLRS